MEKKKYVVLVIDMENDFAKKGGALYIGDHVRDIIPRIVEKVKQAIQDKAPVFYTADRHNENDLEFQMFPRHCVRGTDGSMIIDELALPVKVIPKTRYSGFYETELEAILADINEKDGRPIEEVVVVGVCTDICVLHTVADLRNRDYPVTVYVDCVASFDQEAHEFALKHMEKILGAKVIR